MSMQLLPMAHVLRPQLEAYQRTAWFVWECLERENLITLRAWWASLPAVGVRSSALYPLALLMLALPAPASAARPAPVR